MDKGDGCTVMCEYLMPLNIFAKSYNPHKWETIIIETMDIST